MLRNKLARAVALLIDLDWYVRVALPDKSKTFAHGQLLSSIERRVSVMKKIAEVLDVDLDDLA